MNHQTTPHDTSSRATALLPATELEAARAALATVLQSLTDLTGPLRMLVDTHTRGIGFLTPAARDALDRRTREERAIRDWNARNQFPAPAGDNPTPGNLTAISAEAELTFAVRHSIRFLNHRAAPVDRVPVADDATLRDLLAALEEAAAHASNPRHLDAIREDLDPVHTHVTNVVHGNDQVLLDAPCPYCGRRSLVVHFRDDLIRCDADPVTGERHGCTCPDPLCPCKTAPVSYRHTWYRHKYDERRRAETDSWNHLAGRIGFQRTLKKDQTS